MLHAFRLDATKLRYRDWDDLMAYCRYSASPVGRQLLDLHRESRETWPASDALCSALQVLNHLQDCADDYRLLDRVYLPMTELAAEGIGVEALAASRVVPRAASGVRPDCSTAPRRSSRPRAACRPTSDRPDYAGKVQSSSNSQCACCAGSVAAIRWRLG